MGSKNEENFFTIEIAQDTLDRIIGFINTCDTKVSIILAIFGIIITIIFTGNINVIENLKNIINDSKNIKYFPIFLLLISIVIFLYGLIMLFMALYANIKASGEKSIIYFKDISLSEDYEAYKQKIKNMNSENFLDDIIKQIYKNSMICSKKYERYNLGIKCSMFGFILFIIVYGGIL